MRKKERERIKRIIILIALLGGGALFLSRFGPKMRKGKTPEAIETVQERIRETEFGKTVFKVLGGKVEEETKEGEKKEQEEGKEEGKKEKQSIVERVKEKIKKVIIEKSSQKLLSLLETLPPEELEELRKELCPKFCERGW